MTGQSTFKSDLKRSQAIEDKLCDIIIKAGFKASTTQDKGHYSGYDLIINDKTTIELKVDYESELTGNIAVEVSKVINGKEQKSGLSITSADYYVYHLPNEPNIFYFIQTNKLKVIKDKAFNMVRGGDNNSVWLRLYRKDVFTSYCCNIDTTKNIRMDILKIMHPTIF
jgi:hypothetical protein